MRIGILTLPLHTNYGGILQAYALQTVLERMGHEVLVLTKDRVVVPKGWSALRLYSKRIIKKFIYNEKIGVIPELKTLPKYRLLSKNTQLFIDKYINTYVYNNLCDLKEKSLKLDVIVVGSDQIWRPKYVHNTLRDTIANAFLSFARQWDVKRISYAASFGTDEWEFTEEQSEKVKEFVCKFNAISVREKSGVRLCSDYLGVSAEHVLDPTMLLDAVDYDNLIDASLTIREKRHGYLMNYVLDSNSEIERLIEKVSIDKGFFPYKLDVSDYADGTMVQPAVEEWLCAIRDAEFVITDSFHASVFCLIFNKPFIVVGNKQRGYGRFSSLMETMKLKNNLICNIEQYDENCDYNISKESRESLETYRKTSYDFLNYNLKL